MKASGRPRAELQAPATSVIASSSLLQWRKHRRGVVAAPATPSAGAIAMALGSAVDAITFLDRDWRITFINQRSAELLGGSREVLLGRNLWDCTLGAASGRAFDEFHRAMRDQVSVVFELLSRSAGRVLQCLALPSPEGLFVITRDVSATGAVAMAGAPQGLGPSMRPIVVEALQSSERRFRALIENSLDALLMVDAHGHALYASPRVFGEDGLLPLNSVGMGLLEHVHPADRERAREDFLHVVAEPGRTISSSYRVRHRNGRWIWIEGTAQNRLHDPAVRAIVINCRDVTEQREAEGAYRALVDHSFQAQLIAQHGRIVFANPTLAQMIDRPLDEIYSLSFAEMIYMVHPDDRAAAKRSFADRLAGLDVEPVFAFRHVRSDGSERWLECRAATIEYRGEAAVQVALLDATEKRHAEEALRFSEQHFRSLIEGARPGDRRRRRRPDPLREPVAPARTRLDARGAGRPKHARARAPRGSGAAGA